jgi:hypothetical protein
VKYATLVTYVNFTGQEEEAGEGKGRRLEVGDQRSGVGKSENQKGRGRTGNRGQRSEIRK